MGQICVSLDVETTGLSPREHEIIEVAAVKFQGREVLDTFHSPVRPTQPLPPFIQRLTGIAPSDLAQAPPFAAIRPALGEFLGAWPVVGHRVSFDLAFLEAQGLALANPAYDTRELAPIVLPRLGDYSLASVAQALGQARRQRHRALPDALTTHEVFLALAQKVQGLDPALLSEVLRFAQGWGWPLCFLFQEALGDKKPAPAGWGEGLGIRLLPRAREVGEPLRTRSPAQPLDVQEVASSLSPGGPLSCSLPGYEHRPEQVEMARAVAQALSQGQRLLVEAGTGVGKSLAYLLPAALFSSRNGTPVVVSTNTLSLQEQLLDKDIPQLVQALGPAALPHFRAVALKGRGNYLCLRRWCLYTGSTPPVQDRAALLRILAWLPTTEAGDRAELNLAAGEAVVWGKVCAQECPANCQYMRQGLCFLHRARERARRAHLVVANHALLLSDLASQGNALPEYGHLIVDEAHNLEEEATQQFGFRLSQALLADYLERVGRPRPQATGLQAALAALLDRSGPPGARRPRQLAEPAQALGVAVERAREKLEQFFLEVRAFAQGQQGQGGYERWLRLTPARRAQPGWAQVEGSGEDLRLALGDVEVGLGRLLAALEGAPSAEGRSPHHQDLLAEAAALAREASATIQQLAALASAPEPGAVYWMALAGDEVALHAAPLQVGPLLADSLFSRMESVVLTGATLSTEGTFRYIQERLGLEADRELMLGSPFNYLASTLILLPQDIPEPGRPGYEEAVARVLGELCRASQGRALALFTSHAALRQAREALNPLLEAEGIQVLGQGVDGSPGWLLSQLRTQGRTVLLGVASLWEGVDVAGEALSLLAVARLPFAVPTEPVTEARSELYEDPFNQYSLPQAILRFKQGFGRLIRSRDDRGVLAVLDRRIQSKAYGRAFLNSLPPCAVRRGRWRELVPEVAGWLGQ